MAGRANRLAAAPIGRFYPPSAQSERRGKPTGDPRMNRLLVRLALVAAGVAIIVVGLAGRI
jgi:hypothetical protein